MDNRIGKARQKSFFVVWHCSLVFGMFCSTYRLFSHSTVTIPCCIQRVSSGSNVLLHVKPNAKETKIKGRGWIFLEQCLTLLTGFGTTMSISVAEVPKEGKVNKKLAVWLAEKCGLHKEEVSLIKGEKSRTKIFFLSGIEPQKVHAMLNEERNNK